jgi:hypothetical protein
MLVLRVRFARRYRGVRGDRVVHRWFQQASVPRIV